MKKVIKEFRGSYGFLSNFYTAYIKYNFDSLPFYHYHDERERGNLIAMTLEHFFQACKAYTYGGHFKIVTSPNPKTAKKRGRETYLRGDWDAIKIDVMEYGLRMKFDQNPELKQRLINTHPWILKEGNTWGDMYWGVDLETGKGNNILGHLLMKLRNEYMFPQNEIKSAFAEIIDELEEI